MFWPYFFHIPFLQTDIFRPFPNKLEFLVIFKILNLNKLFPFLLNEKGELFLLTLKLNHCPYDLVL